MTGQPNRPISPHLGIYRRSPAMMVSIIHRITGFILSTAGMLTLLWWLSSIASGPESFAHFHKFVVSAGMDATLWPKICNWFFRLLAITVLYSFYQHLFSGIRHLLMDMGAGFELDANRKMTWAVFFTAFLATALTVIAVAYRFLGN